MKTINSGGNHEKIEYKEKKRERGKLANPKKWCMDMRPVNAVTADEH
jgi:hypothetical protein